MGQTFDEILVNAGATEPLPGWLGAPRPHGRLLFPLTVDLPQANVGAGQMLLVVRRPGGYCARVLTPVVILHCAGARTEEGNVLLKDASRRGGLDPVRSLRSDEHERDADCWLHARRFCLSRLPVEG